MCNRVSLGNKEHSPSTCPLSIHEFAKMSFYETREYGDLRNEVKKKRLRRITHPGNHQQPEQAGCVPSVNSKAASLTIQSWKFQELTKTRENPA